jgi:adenine-specific DNA methylase
MTIEALKYQIFEKIARIQNEVVLQRVKDMLENISKDNDLLYRVLKPVKEKITVEDLVQEQNYKGFDREAFNKLVAELNIQDPIEELLALSTP